MDQESPRFRQVLRDSAQKLGLATFWRWWEGQLVPLVPAAPRTAVRRLRIRPVLAFEGEAAALWEPRVTNGVLAYAETARIPLVGDSASILQAGHAAVDSLPRRAYGGAVGAAKVVVALPPGKVLRKQLTFPAAVEENLRQVVAYDLDRHTPFRPEDLYFDAVVIGRDAARKEIRVDLAAAQKSVVDPARRQAESWGATVVAIAPDLPDPGAAMRAPSRLNLLPPAERPESAAWKRWQWWLPAGVLAIAAVAAVALPIWQKRDFVIALSGVVEEARKRAAESDALRGELEQLAADYNYALGRKYAFPGTVQLLDDVSKLLPDDTWLTQFEVKSTPKGKEPHREVLLRGESANAGRLVSLLEESKLFEQAAPRSPTTKIQPPPGEIFDLGAQLKPLAAPPTVELTSADVPAAPAALVPPPSAAAPAPVATPAPVVTRAPEAAATAEPAAAAAAPKAAPDGSVAVPAPVADEAEPAGPRGRARRGGAAARATQAAPGPAPTPAPAEAPAAAPAPVGEGDKTP